MFAHRYQKSVKGIIRKPGLFMLVYAGIIAAVAGLAMTLPTSFLPDEDQGALMTQVQLPVGSTTDRTVAVLKQVQEIYQKDPAVKYVCLRPQGAMAGSTGTPTSFTISLQGQLN